MIFGIELDGGKAWRRRLPEALEGGYEHGVEGMNCFWMVLLCGGRSRPWAVTCRKPLGTSRALTCLCLKVSWWGSLDLTSGVSCSPQVPVYLKKFMSHSLASNTPCCAAVGNRGGRLVPPPFGQTIKLQPDFVLICQLAASYRQ